jgi:signal transduction histidine kinase
MTAVHAPGAAVTGADGRLIASHGTPPDPTPGSGTAVLPLWYGGQQLGELRVAPGFPGRAYAAPELRLLAALALQVAVVVRAFELTEALEAERDRVLAAIRTERDRIRTELHDGLGPSLSGLDLGMQALAETLRQPGAPSPNGLLDRMKEEAGLALGEVRRIIDGLRPAPLDTMTLPDAIRRHIQTTCSTVPVEVTATDLPTLPPQVESAAYRITAEALNNAARHARAHRVEVTMTAPNGALQITVADDGCGMPPSTTAAGNGANLGLASMRSRAEALGGQLAIASGAGGTTVSATLPLGSA